MAKKIKPEEMSIEQRLKNLYQLQTYLSEIDKLKTLRGELPMEVQDLEDELEGLHTRISKIDAEVAEKNKEIAGYDAKVAENNTLIERYEEQIKEVANNRQYESFQKEIEYRQVDSQLQEKNKAKAQHRIEDLNAKRAEAEAEVAERQADLDVKKSELDGIISENKAEEEKLQEKAKSLELTIEERLLTAFKRIRKNSRNGLGIVYVQRDACGGCFNKIPPQRQLDIRMHKKIIVCEYCGRILVDPELAGVKIKPVEEKKPVRRRRATAAKKTETTDKAE